MSGRIETHDFAVLLRRARQRIALSGSVAQIAQRADIDPRQQAPRGQVVGILGNDGLRFEHGVANALRLKVDFGEFFADLLAGGIERVRLLVKFDGPVGVFCVTGDFILLLIVVAEREIVIGLGAAYPRRPGARTWRTAWQSADSRMG